MKKNKDIQREYFYEGAYPTDTQFHEVIDSALGVLDSTDDLPTAGAGNLGDEYKVGNVFYKCEQVSGGYQWVAKATATPTDDYNDLTNKPTINNVRISGDIEDIDELGALSQNTGKYDAAQEADIVSSSLIYIKGANKWVKTTLGDLVAALNLVNATVLATFKTEVLAEAAAQTAASLASKMNADLSNIEYVDSFPGNAMIPIVTDSGTKKTTLTNVATYTVTQAGAISSANDKELNKYRKVLELEGEQDGSNVTFTVVGGYKTGTSVLYLNGQLMAAGRDYDETDTQTITMLTYIPEAEDVMVFMAIPLES